MMRLPKIDHVAPATVPEACSFLDKHGADARVLAGGTDMMVACKLRNIKSAFLVSLGSIPSLKGIRFQEGEGLNIGPMTSLNDVRYHSDVLNHYPALAQASAAVGTVQLQYMGTLGGNLCLNTRCIYYNQSDSWRKSRAVCLKMGGDVCHVVSKGKTCYAVFSGDTAPALIALGGQVKLISSSGERVMAAKDLYSDEGKAPITLQPGEVLAEIQVPPPRGKQKSIYLKYRIRGAIDFPLIGVAARMDSNGEGTCTECKVVLTAVGSGPSEVPEAGELLKGRVPTDELIGQAAEKAVKKAHPVANTSGSTPTYRRKMAGILTRRALSALANELSLA